jgi:hypothetical protein
VSGDRKATAKPCCQTDSRSPPANGLMDCSAKRHLRLTSSGRRTFGVIAIRSGEMCSNVLTLCQNSAPFRPGVQYVESSRDSQENCGHNAWHRRATRERLQIAMLGQLGGKEWKNPTPDTADTVKTGVEHFQHHCEMCHGLEVTTPAFRLRRRCPLLSLTSVTRMFNSIQTDNSSGSLRTAFALAARPDGISDNGWNARANTPYGEAHLPSPMETAREEDTRRGSIAGENRRLHSLTAGPARRRPQ